MQASASCGASVFLSYLLICMVENIQSSVRMDYRSDTQASDSLWSSPLRAW
jgi:hypothetical protein